LSVKVINEHFFVGVVIGQVDGWRRLLRRYSGRRSMMERTRYRVRYGSVCRRSSDNGRW
jgi:hypothetical protein